MGKAKKGRKGGRGKVIVGGFDEDDDIVGRIE